MNTFATYAANAASLVIAGSLIYRQLQTRRIDRDSLWVRPAVLITLAAALGAASIYLAPARMWMLALSVIIGIAIGTAAGLLVTRSTLSQSAARLGELTLHPSIAAAAVWVAIFVAGFIARATLGSILPIVYLDVNVAVTAVYAVAVAVIALNYRRAMSLPILA